MVRFNKPKAAAQPMASAGGGSAGRCCHGGPRDLHLRAHWWQFVLTSEGGHQLNPTLAGDRFGIWTGNASGS